MLNVKNNSLSYQAAVILQQKMAKTMAILIVLLIMNLASSETISLTSPSNLTSIINNATNSSINTSSPNTTSSDVSNVTGNFNCFNLSASGTCYECLFGFYLKKGGCLSSNANCKTYSTSSADCQSCFIGNSLVNGSCSLDSSLQLFGGCAILQANFCSKCSAGYYFNDDGNCEMVDSWCKIFDFQQKLCIGCIDGYILSRNQQRCLTKSSLTEGIEKNINCELWIDNECSNCFKGFININDTCIDAAQIDPRCQIWNGQVCQTCSAYTVFKNKSGKCEDVSVLCVLYDYDSGDCLSCYNGYELRNGSCNLPLNSSSSSNPYCDEYFENSTCIGCYYNYYLDDTDNNTCKPVSSSCESYAQIGGKCITCNLGRVLYNGHCIIPFNGNNNPYCTLYNQLLLCVLCEKSYQLNQQAICG